MSSTTSTTVTSAPAAAAAGAAGATNPSGSSGGTGPSPVAPQLDAVAQISQSSCRYDAANQELVSSGTVRIAGGADGQVEVDVDFADASGDLDSASDVEQVDAGQTVQWEASTVALDPPTGTLTCQVTQG